MENASRALIMAASVLIAIVIVSAFILMMSNLTSYQQSVHSSTLTQQISEFNNEFSTYARNNLRGSDMVSLMNKIIDYNDRYAQTEGYTEMQITVDMNGINEKLKYEKNRSNKLIKLNTYDQTQISDIVGAPNTGSTTSDTADGTIRQLEAKYEQKYCNQLAAEISTIADIAYSSDSTVEKRNAFDQEGILPLKFSDGKALKYGDVSDIYNDACVYYEYVQFKRAYFDCVGSPEYDKHTGRITKLEFKCTKVGV